MRSTTIFSAWRLAAWVGGAFVAVGLAAWPVWSQAPAPPKAEDKPDAKAPKAPDVKPDQNPDLPAPPTAKPDDKPDAKPDAKPNDKPDPKPEAKPDDKPPTDKAPRDPNRPPDAPRNPNAPDAPRNPNAPDAPRDPSAPGPNRPDRPDRPDAPRDPNQPRNPAQPRDPADRRDAADDRRDDRRDAANDRRDDRRDATDDRRDDRRDARDDRRDDVRAGADVRAGVRAGARGEFRAADIRAADIGIWFNRNTQNGLVISSVGSSGAIARLGFREGDRIVSVNGQRVLRETDFVTYLFADNVRRDRVQVIVFRDGREQVIWVEPHVLVQDYTTTYDQVDPVEEFGIIVDDRYTDQIVVWRVIPRSPAYYAGIRAGDVLVSFHNKRLASPRELVTVVQGLDTGVIPVQVMRNRQARTIEVDYTRGGRRTSLRPNVDGRDNVNDVERPNERREDRIEDRRDRREDNREGRPQTNDPNPDAPRLERTPAPQPAPAPQPEPRRRLFPRGR